MKRILLYFIIIGSTVYALTKTKIPSDFIIEKNRIALVAGQALSLEQFIAANPSTKKYKKLYFLVDGKDKPINQIDQFENAVKSIPIIIPKKFLKIDIIVQNPTPWITEFLQKIDGVNRLSFEQSPDLKMHFEASLNSIMYFTILNPELVEQLTSRHAKGAISLLFVADPFPASAAFGSHTHNPVDYLVKYCFDHGKKGDFESLYNPDGTIIDDIAEIFAQENYDDK